MELEEGVFAAEKIVQQRVKKGKKEYLVKWVGCTPDQNTWEPARNIYDKRLIAAFEQSQQRSPVKRGRKPKQVIQQQQQHERQVLPFRGGHTHNRAVSSSSSSSSCSSDEEADNNDDSTRDNRSVSASSDDSTSSSSSEEEEQESEEEEKPKKGRGRPRQEPAAKKSASQSSGGTNLSGPRATNSPLKEKSPIRESLKRKAEVIQESGRIGVTITTTPKTSPTASNGSANNIFGNDVANVVEAASNLLSLRHGTPISAGNTQPPPPAKVARTTSSSSTGSGKSGRPVRAAATNSNGTALQNGNSHVQPQQEPDALPAEYWVTKQPLADQIVLTDVTVNLTTVTVRECKTKDEFFKTGATVPPTTAPATDDLKPKVQQPVNESKK